MEKGQVQSELLEFDTSPILEVEVTIEERVTYKIVIGVIDEHLRDAIQEFAEKITESSSYTVIEDKLPGVLKILCDGSSMAIPYDKISYVHTEKYPHNEKLTVNEEVFMNK